MTARLRRSVLVASAVGGLALLGSSVQGVTAMDAELRSSLRSLPDPQERAIPVVDRHDCPQRDRVIVLEREV